MSRLSVVFVNYRSGALLISALDALLRSVKRGGFEILIVNNDSASDLRLVKTCDWPSTRVIQNASNLGFGAAANAGYQQSSGDFVLFLNPDVRVQPGSVESLIRALECHPDAGIALPQLRYPDGVLQYSCRRFYSYSSLLMRRGPWKPLFRGHPVVKTHLMYDWDHSSLTAVDWGLGAAMLVRRAAVPGRDLFDERFFLYFEDVDLCLRMRQSGWKVLYEPAAVMIHQHRRESARPGAILARRHHLVSLVKFLGKHRLRPAGAKVG